MNKLITAVSHPRLSTSPWKEVRSELVSFSKVLKLFADDMKESCARSEERHASLHPLRCPDINSESHDIAVSKGPIKLIYAKLMCRLEEANFYEPILIDGELSVTDKFARYRFFNNLSLPCCAHLHVYHAGSQLGNIYYIWKIPNEVKNQSAKDNLSAIAQVNGQLPVYTSRALRKAFSDRYQHVKKITPAVLRNMYRYLTDDCSSESQSSEIDRRLELMLDDPDIDLTVDKRELNLGRNPIFEPFWKEVDVLLEEYGKAVHERRHGPDVAYLPVAISVPDLIKKVKDKLPADSPVPSEAWVRFQFWPRNRFSETAKHYNCRFDVKYKVQSRQLHKSHSDA